MMEDYFNPGFKTKPAVHIGSQTMRLYDGDESEQAVEALHIAGASEGDVVVVRNVDSDYIEYWKELMGKVHIVNIQTKNKGRYLSHLILDDQLVINEIKQSMFPGAKMMVYFPTQLEEKVAQMLGIALHGTPKHSLLYGTKVGIRTLAKQEHLSMPEGKVCATADQVQKVAEHLFESYESIIIKHSLSSAGRWMKRIKRSEHVIYEKLLDELSGGKFNDGMDEFVVEAWVKSSISLCAHIEILDGQPPQIVAAWQQVFDTDGISYLGAGPLMLSSDILIRLLEEINKLAQALQKNGARGSFAPDYIITSTDEKQYDPNTPLLIELNARVPFTAFPLEIIKQVKGIIGQGFYSTALSLPRRVSFSEVKTKLQNYNLLITNRHSTASGVIPFNIAQLNWKKLYFVAMGNDWEHVQDIVRQTTEIFTD